MVYLTRGPADQGSDAARAPDEAQRLASAKAVVRRNQVGLTVSFSPNSDYDGFDCSARANSLFGERGFRRGNECRMYRYAQVESALMSLNSIGESGRGALRGRLKNLQKFGVTPVSPGKGARIAYDFSDVMLLALCLEFAQFGIDPSRIASIKQHIWPYVENILDREQIEQGLVLAAQPYIMSGSILEERSASNEKFFGIVGIEGSSRRWIYNINNLPSLIEERAIIINVSNLHKDLRDALIKTGK